MGPKDEKNGKLDIKAFADAFVNSANRTRFVIIVIVFASILPFIGFWNAQLRSWINCRLKIAKRAYIVQRREELESKFESLQRDTLQYKIVRDSLIDLYEKDRLLFEDSTLYANAREFLYKRMFVTPNGLEKYIEELERLRTQRVLYTQIPVFGVTFDVNDFGFFAGLAFTIILIWFRLSLWRELTNLKTVFQEAQEEGELGICYRYLSMRQMLSVPRFLHGTSYEPKRRFWRNIRFVLFVLPLLVQATVVFWDIWSTYIEKTVTEPSYSRVIVYIGVVFLAAIVILTINCLKLGKETDKEWNRVFKEITK